MVTTIVTSFLMVHPHSIGLAKEFVQIFPSYVTEKSKWILANPIPCSRSCIIYFSLLALELLQCQDVRCLQDIMHVEYINATWNYRRINTLQLLFTGCAALEWWLYGAGVTLRRYSMSKGKWKSLSKMVGGTKSHLESNPKTCQRCSEGSNKPCVHQDPETPQRLRQNCVWVSPVEVRVSRGLLQEEGLWMQ